MAVPNTTTFSLEDVRTELALGATTSLSACFTASVDASFDVLYKGSKNQLDDFRNYGAVCNTTTSLNFYPSSGQATSGGGTCPIGGSEVGHYYTGAGADIANGDIVYMDAGGCNLFNGGDLWYRVRKNTSGFYSVRISPIGAASGIISCT